MGLPRVLLQLNHPLIHREDSVSTLHQVLGWVLEGRHDAEKQGCYPHRVLRNAAVNQMKSQATITHSMGTAVLR